MVIALMGGCHGVFLLWGFSGDRTGLMPNRVKPPMPMMRPPAVPMKGKPMPSAHPHKNLGAYLHAPKKGRS